MRGKKARAQRRLVPQLNGSLAAYLESKGAPPQYIEAVLLRNRRDANKRGRRSQLSPQSAPFDEAREAARLARRKNAPLRTSVLASLVPLEAA